MSVQVNVTSVDFATRTVNVEALKNGKKIFKSPMKYKRLAKADIEKQLRKELKAFDTPLWGGLAIFFLCRIDG
ncbi:hypothetical protein ACS125_15305 [Acinetobacter sp. PFS20]|uniref:hypothetical protein n=1 Tax=Acinetobacter sp. PFS20 TaxID=3458434 RepID=UPI003FD2C7C3